MSELTRTEVYNAQQFSDNLYYLLQQTDKRMSQYVTMKSISNSSGEWQDRIGSLSWKAANGLIERPQDQPGVYDLSFPMTLRSSLTEKKLSPLSMS